jgi:hypothetical protein
MYFLLNNIKSNKEEGEDFDEKEFEIYNVISFI